MHEYSRQQATSRYDLGEQKSAGRLAFPICETHCETFVENCLIFTLNKPRCVIGVCPANGNTVTPVVPGLPGMLVMCRLYEADARMRSAPDRTVWPDEPSCSSLTACFGAKSRLPGGCLPGGCWQQIELSGFVASELSAYCDLAVLGRKVEGEARSL